MLPAAGSGDNANSEFLRVVTNDPGAGWAPAGVEIAPHFPGQKAGTIDVQGIALTMAGKDFAPARDPVADKSAAQGPSAAPVDHLAELKANVKGPWSPLVERLPPATPAGLDTVRTTTFLHLFNRIPGYEAFEAYLAADIGLDMYRKAASEAEKAVKLDREWFAAIEETVKKLAAGMPAEQLHAELLSAYTRLSSTGRKVMAAQPYVQTIGDEPTRSMLKGEWKSLPLDAPGAVKEPTKDDAQLKAQFEALKKQVLDCDPAKRDAEGRAGRKALSIAFETADRRVLDMLRADPTVSIRIAALSNADKSEAGTNPADYVDLALQGDSAHRLYWDIMKLPDIEGRFELVKSYLTDRPGDDNLAVRSRIMQNQYLASEIAGWSADKQRDISRLIARGTATKQPIDILHDAGVGKASALEALRAAIQLGQTPAFAGLRSDAMLRQSLETGANKEVANLAGMHLSAADFCLRAWGIPVGGAKDPESALAKDEVNPNPEKPLDANEWKTLNELFTRTVNALGKEFDSWLFVRNETIQNILTGYENECAAPGMRDLFQRSHLHPGVELTNRANADSRIGNLRQRLHKNVDDDTRAVCERVLGMRVDPAVIGRIDGQVTVAGEDKKENGKGLIPLDQAIRSVKIKGDITVSQMTRSRAEKMANKLNAWHLWGGAAKKDIVEIFSDYAGKFGCPSEAAPGQPEKRVIDELEDLTGLKGKINAIELLVNEFHAVPGGGDLAGKINERVEESERAACLREMGLDAAAVAARNHAKLVVPPTELETEAETLWTALLGAQSAGGDDLRMIPLETAGNAWKHARGLDNTLDPNAPGTFRATYHTKHGIDPKRHVVEVARMLVATGNQSSDRRIDTVATAFDVPAGEIEAAVTAPVQQLKPTPNGFTVDAANEAASRIWAALHKGDIVKVRAEIDGRRPEEQQLIKQCFRNLSGDIELEFYIQQGLAAASDFNVKQVGGEGVRAAGAADRDKQLAATTDAKSWTETLDVVQTGQVGILTRFSVALQNSDKNEVFRIADDATLEDRKAILGDEPSMGKLRTTLDGVEFDRVYAVLSGTGDMATRLYSRSHGDVSGSFSHMFTGTDDDGMRRDIKQYAARRREFHTQQAEDQGQSLKDKSVLDRIQGAVKRDLLATYDNPDVKKLIEDETRTWWLDDAKDGRELEGKLLNGGEDDNTSALRSDDFEWSSDILNQTKQLSLEQRTKYRSDPEFMRKVWERCTDIKNRKLILLALQSDEPTGEDHILKLVEISGGMSSGAEAREQIARLTTREIARLRKEPDLVNDVCGVLNQDEQTRFRAVLGFDTKTALAAVCATEAKADGTAPAAKDTAGKDADVPKMYTLGSKEQPVPGQITEEELTRLGYLRLQSQQRLHLGASSSWMRLVKETVEVYKADFKPALIMPASPDAPQPGKAVDQTKVAEEAAKKEETRLRAAVWADVQADVVACAKDNSAKLSAEDAKARIERAVLKTGTDSADPSDLLLGEALHWYGNEDKEIEATIKAASDEHVLKQWSSVAQRKFPQPGGESFKEVYGAYTKAKTQQPDPSKPTDGDALRAAKTSFQRYVIEPSFSFEGLLLPRSGGHWADSTPTDHAGQQLDRDNPTYAKYRASINERIRTLDGEKVATEIGATGEDAAMITSKLRGALTNFSIARENYALHRGDGGGTFGQDPGRELDRSFGDYRREIGKAEDATAGGKDISDRDARKLDKLDTDVTERAADYQAAREQAAMVAAAIVSTVIGVVVTALTAGAATPLAMMMYGALTSAAAATGEVLTKEAILGKTYDASGEGLRSIAGAAATGFIAGGAQHYAGAFMNGLSGAESAAQQGATVAAAAAKTPPLWNRMLQTGGRTIVQSSITGLSDVAGSALKPSTWSHGWSEGWQRALDDGLNELKSKPLQILRATITAMAGEVAANPQANNDAAKPGQRIGMERVLKQVATDLPQNTVTAVVDAGIGTALGEVNTVPQAMGSVGQQVATSARDVGMGIHGTGLHDGAVNRGTAESFVQSEIMTNPHLFMSEQERALYAKAVEESYVRHQPISAVEFTQARNALACMKAASNPEYIKLSSEEQARFIKWVREAPSTDEFKMRAARDPIEALNTIPRPAAEVRHAPGTDAGKAQAATDRAKAAIEQLKLLLTEARTSVPANAAEAQAALSKVNGHIAAADAHLSDAQKAAGEIRELLTRLETAGKDANELAAIKTELERADAAAKQAKSLRDSLEGSRHELENLANGKTPPPITAAVTDPNAPKAPVEYTCKPGEIPPGLGAAEQQAFEEAQRLYNKLTTDEYQQEPAAARRWLQYLAQHGIKIAGHAVEVDAAHSMSKDDPTKKGSVREVAQEAKTYEAATATMTGDTSGGNAPQTHFEQGARAKNAHGLSEATCNAALAELGKAASQFSVKEQAGNKIEINLKDGTVLKIHVTKPQPTENGAVAGMRGTPPDHIQVWVDSSILDEHVPRALGGIIHEAVAKYDTKATSHDSRYGQLDAMLAHLQKVAADELAGPKKVEAKDANHPTAKEINDAAEVNAKRESSARLAAEIDQLLFAMGMQDPTKRAEHLKNMEPKLAELVKARLDGAAIHFDKSKMLSPEAVAKPPESVVVANGAATSNVLPDAPKATRPYSEADLATVTELRVQMQAIKEIDARLAQRDQKGADGRTVAVGESLRRRELVNRVKVLLEALQIGGTDQAYIKARMEELKAVFPGVEADLVPEITQRVERRRATEARHKDAVDWRAKQEEARAQLLATVMGKEPFTTERAVIGNGMTGATVISQLGIEPKNGMIDPAMVLMLGKGDTAGQFKDDSFWGQRAEVFDPANPGKGGAHPLFEGENHGGLQGGVEDPGEFVRMGELNDSLDLARKRLGITGLDAMVVKREKYDPNNKATPEFPPDIADKYPLRLTVKIGDQVKHIYCAYTDITTGLGNTQLPNEGILKPEDREALIRTGTVFSGEQLLFGQRSAKGKRVLVVQFGPTGAWAAQDAAAQGAEHVDWAAGGGSEAANKKSYDFTKSLDRTQDAFTNKEIHITTNTIVSIAKSGEGGVVTYGYEEGGKLVTYDVYYDMIAMTMGFDQTGNKAKQPSMGGGAQTGTLLGGDKLVPQGDRADRSKAAVGETEDGRTTVYSGAVFQNPNFDDPKSAEMAERRKSQPASADTPPGDTRTMEVGGAHAQIAGKESRAHQWMEDIRGKLSEVDRAKFDTKTKFKTPEETLKMFGGDAHKPDGFEVSAADVKSKLSD